MGQLSTLHLQAAIVALLPLATSFVLPTSFSDQKPFSFPSEDADTTFLAPADDATHSRIPTQYESTVLGRRLLSLSTTGVLSTIFPSEKQSRTLENRPSSIGGSPFGMIDYVADCEEFGDPTLLGINIANTFRNAAPEAEGQIKNITLTIDWWTQYRDLRTRQNRNINNTDGDGDDDPLHAELEPSFDLGLYSPASLPRLALVGYLEPISHHAIVRDRIPRCYKIRHPDAAWWEPGNPEAPHSGRWLRLRVQEVYWFGGFGDRAYIGWLKPKEWKFVSQKEIRNARLPGEK